MELRNRRCSRERRNGDNDQKAWRLRAEYTYRKRPGKLGTPHKRLEVSPFGKDADFRLIAASQVQSTVDSSDLLGSGDVSLTIPPKSNAGLTSPFDAVIAIGVLIKGETMHFEYIADAVSTGLMRVGLDTGVPVVFGLLTVLNEKQAMVRAGMVEGEMHNHAFDWGSAAVELGSKGKKWTQGKLS
jgi:6,7-dimethyl-8-ribityllumazine synthase